MVAFWDALVAGKAETHTWQHVLQKAGRTPLLMGGGDACKSCAAPCLGRFMLPPAAATAAESPASLFLHLGWRCLAPLQSGGSGAACVAAATPSVKLSSPTQQKVNAAPCGAQQVLEVHPQQCQGHDYHQVQNYVLYTDSDLIIN